MARRKFIYHHFVNYKEVTKSEFINALNRTFVRCDTNYDNPLLNISYTDTEVVKRKYNYYKAHPNTTELIINENNPKSDISFRIRREEVK